MEQENNNFNLATSNNFIFLGIMAEYNQDVALYSTFTVVNACLGAAIFFFHSTGNEAVRAKIGGLVGGAKK